MAVRPTTSKSLSLSVVGMYARKFIIYGAVGLLIFTVGRFLFSTSVTLYKRLNPKPAPPPTIGFGLIPAPVFPTQAQSVRPQQYVLDTVGKVLPNFSDRANVYFVPTSLPSLFALDQAKQRASALGFVFEPEKVSTNVYRWRRTAPLNATLEIDIVQGTMTLRSDWAASVTLLDQNIVPTDSQLMSETRALLRSADLLPADIATATPIITPMRALAGELKPANSISDADFAEVNLWRLTPDGKPTVTTTKGRGIVRVLFSGSRDQGQRVLEIDSSYVPVSWDQVETYPLWSTGLAWQALQGGSGFITQPVAAPTVTIRSVRLAYYESNTPQSYFQPVYVFEGDGGFQAIIPALNPQVYANPGSVPVVSP
jgi:hypothetical protein